MRRWKRWVGLAAGLWLALCLVGQLTRRHGIPVPADDGEASVLVLSSALPQPLTAFAVHTWFVVRDKGETAWERWEVWNEPDEGERSWGHVTVNLLPPAEGLWEG